MPATLAKQVRLAAYKNLQMKRRDKGKTVGEILCKQLGILTVTPPSCSSLLIPYGHLKAAQRQICEFERQRAYRCLSLAKLSGAHAALCSLLQHLYTTWESCA